MDDDLKDSPDAPIRLHDHPSVNKLQPRHKRPYNRRAPFTDQEMADDLAGEIKAHRLIQELDESQLARLAGVNLPSILRLETASVKDMDLTTLLRVLKALKLRIELTTNG